jgi:replicative DNA helicase
MKPEQLNRRLPQEISTGYLPPQCPELEEAVLGALMVESSVALNAIADVRLKAEHFYLEQHREIFNAIMKLSAASRPVDMKTVINQLRTDGKIEMIGGPAFVAELTSRVSSAASTEYHARVIQEKWMAREIILITGKFSLKAFQDMEEVGDLLEQLETELFNINLFKSAASRSRDILSLYKDTVDNLQKKKSSRGLTGISTGFRLLDHLTSGWQNSDLVIIAARAGMGKSAFMLKTARASSGRDLPTLICSLEMSDRQLVERLISIEHSIHNDTLRSGLLSDDEWQRIMRDIPSGRGGLRALHDSKLWIDDTPALSLMDLRSKVRRIHAQHGLGLLVVDYLQLMRGENVKNGNREQEISSISRGLKGIAKELNIPVLALSQLSREVEKTADKRPMLSHLRESGSIEQDADIVMFLYRPEYYKIMVDEMGMPTNGRGEIIIAKHRNGGTGTIPVKFEGIYTRFLDDDSGQ